MKTQILTGLTAAALVSVVYASAASAATISFDASIPVQLTDFSTSVGLQKFDPSLGTLQSVELQLEGILQSTVEYENRGPSPTTITAEVLNALLSLSAPSASIQLSVSPLISETRNATGFDGTIDFGGTSGATFNVSVSETDDQTFTGASDLAFFTGTGSTNFSFSASATSSVTGPGNILSAIATSAGATARVTYVFEETTVRVPESSPTLGLVAVGLLGSGLLLKSKQKVTAV